MEAVGAGGMTERVGSIEDRVLQVPRPRWTTIYIYLSLSINRSISIFIILFAILLEHQHRHGGRGRKAPNIGTFQVQSTAIVCRL